MKLHRKLLFLTTITTMMFSAAACSSDKEEDLIEPEIKPVDTIPEQPNYDASQTYTLSIIRVDHKSSKLVTYEGSEADKIYNVFNNTLNQYKSHFTAPWDYRFFSNKRTEGIAAGDLYAKARFDTIVTALKRFETDFNITANDYDYGRGKFAEAFYIKVNRGDSTLFTSDTLEFKYDEPYRYEFSSTKYEFDGKKFGGVYIPLDSALTYFNNASTFRLSHYKIFKPNKQLYMPQSEEPFINYVEITSGKFLYFYDFSPERTNQYILRDNSGEWYMLLYGDADRVTNVAIKVKLNVKKLK